MANVKNFGLIGVSDDVQYGKAGPRLRQTSGTFNFRNVSNSGDAALTAAGITSSSGNITLTTGHLIASAGDLNATLGDLNLEATDATVVIGTDTTLSRQQAGVFQFNGTAALVLPVGTAAQRPGTPATGMFRFNDDSDSIEFYNGTVWTQVSGTSALQTEIDNIETSLGAGINSDGTFNANGFTDNAALTDPTSFTNAIQQIADFAASKDTLDEILPGTAGEIIWNNAGTWTTDVPGATSGVQAYDAELTAIAGLAGTGFVVITGAGTAASRSITGSAGRITVTNGDGVTSSPTIDLDTLTDAGTGTFLKITRDSYGRVEGTTAVVAGDITALVDGTYVNVAGDTMTGTLNMGNFYVTMDNAPVSDTQAANKAYVDAVAAGLSWKQATASATTADIPGFSAGVITISNANATYFPDSGLAAIVDGVRFVANARVLVKNQSNTNENGIYVVTTAGVEGTTDAVLTRASDMNAAAEFYGATVFVTGGTVNDNSGWTQTEIVTTVNTDPVVWVQFSGSNTYTWGTGLQQSGNTISVNLGAGITELPSDEVGLDVVSNLALQLTSALTGGQLTFLLDAGSGLEQSSSGLKISDNGVTNAMLLNDAISLDADSGTGSVALGGTLDIVGNATQGIVTSTSGSQVVVTASDATSGQKGVASFNSTSFTVTSGAVTLNTVDVGHGGTGATTLLDTAVLIGNGTGAVEATTALTFDSSTDVLTVGGATGMSITAAGGDVTIASLDANADLVLSPNGTGQVVIGPAGAGVISSDSAQTLTVDGDAGLTLTAGTSGDVTIDSVAGDVVINTSDDVLIDLTNNTTSKVSLTTVTAVNYATDLADNDLVNKYYVDTVAGSAAGDIKGLTATFSLAAADTFNIGDVLPANATVLKVKLNVTAADTGIATVAVGVAGDVDAYMTTAENDPQTTGMYISETAVVNAGVQVIATVAGTPAGAGSATVYVEYQLA